MAGGLAGIQAYLRGVNPCFKRERGEEAQVHSLKVGNIRSRMVGNCYQER